MKPEPPPEDWAGRLIRLKRYETPGEVYFENFMDEFRERQRSEALRWTPMKKPSSASV
jgi:hypothetical protein